MREILFRGKRDKRYGKGWTYGVPYIDYEGDCIMAADCYKHIVIPETVGQYTGLTDKNGVKIFEGDIVKSPHCTYVIMWDSVKALFYLRAPVSRVSSDFYNYFGSDLTVIGNIHDNPMLLKGAKENE